MSKAPAMPMYWDAYLADTTHLTTEEHGAYMLLLAAMWRRNSWVPDDDKDNARIVGVTPAKWRKIKARLVDTVSGLRIADGRITQEKLQKVWENTQENIAKNRKNGAKGGRPKSNKNNDLAKPNGFVSVNPNETIPEPYPYPEPDIDKEKSTKKESSAPRKRVAASVSDLDAFKAVLSDHADGERIAAYVQHRKTKRGACTAHAAKLFLRDAEAAGLSVPDAIDTAISRNWITVKAEWLANEAKRNSGQRSSEDERLAAWGIRDLGGNTRKRRDTNPGPEWNPKVDLSEVQPSAKADEQAAEVLVSDDIDDWLRVDVPPLRVVGGREQ